MTASTLLGGTRSSFAQNEHLTAVDGDVISGIQSQVKPAIFFCRQTWLDNPIKVS